MNSRGAHATATASQPGSSLRAAGWAALLLALPGAAHAYIDPATGSLIVQGLIAGFAAAAVAIRGYWYRIKGFFRRSTSAAKPAGSEPAPPGESG